MTHQPTDSTRRAEKITSSVVGVGYESAHVSRVVHHRAVSEVVSKRPVVDKRLTTSQVVAVIGNMHRRGENVWCQDTSSEEERRTSERTK